jgi:spore germination protein YaaH
LPVIVTIQTFDHEILSQVLNNPDNLKRHIQAIRDVATQNFVDGIDINYESTKLSDKEGYFTLLSELKIELTKVTGGYQFAISLSCYLIKSYLLNSNSADNFAISLT